MSLLTLTNACTPHDGAPGDLTHIRYRPQAHEVKHPDRFVRMLVPSDNPMTEAGVALGRQLFFDPLLSADSSISCAGCHPATRAFSDGLPVSRGIAGRTGTRNAPSLLNVAYFTTGLFWDGRVGTLEELMLHPVQDSNEMGHQWDALVQQLQTHQEYPALYRRAFGIESAAEINADLTAKALAQFVRTLTSGNSRYDQYKAGQLSLTASEDRGRRIFFDIGDGVPTSECGHCHVEPLFSGLEYFNNGLDESYDLSALADAGLGGITGRIGDIGRFRTPSLRNIALTAPYMHDGRFDTLDEVLDHYISGGQHGENVHPNVRKLDFTEQDKRDLIAFLETLTEVDAIAYFKDL